MNITQYYLNLYTLISVHTFILTYNKILYHTHGEFMPKHIASGIKYLAACDLRKKGLSQQEISQKLGIDRSTVSHYLNGRNISLDSIEVAKTILDFNPKDLLLMFNILFNNDLEIIKQLVLIFGLNHYETSVGDECIGCGLCVDLCIMNAIKLDSLKAKVNPLFCCGCLMCVEDCPTKAIKILEAN